MNWPEELLEIFEQPEFENVHPSTPKATADDRIREVFAEINAWYNTHRREPLQTAERPERTYAIQLKSFRETDWKREALRKWDEFNLLDGEIW